MLLTFWVVLMVISGIAAFVAIVTSFSRLEYYHNPFAWLIVGSCFGLLALYAFSEIAGQINAH